MCISYKHSPPPVNYRINDHNLSSKSVVKYLGVFINSHLKWSDHIKHVIAKATRSLNVLRHSLNTCPSSVKAAVYKCIVRHILDYASPVWHLNSSGGIKAGKCSAQSSQMGLWKSVESCQQTMIQMI